MLVTTASVVRVLRLKPTRERRGGAMPFQSLYLFESQQCFLPMGSQASGQPTGVVPRGPLNQRGGQYVRDELDSQKKPLGTPAGWGRAHKFLTAADRAVERRR